MITKTYACATHMLAPRGVLQSLAVQTAVIAAFIVRKKGTSQLLQESLSHSHTAAVFFRKVEACKPHNFRLRCLMMGGQCKL